MEKLKSVSFQELSSQRGTFTLIGKREKTDDPNIDGIIIEFDGNPDGVICIPKSYIEDLEYGLFYRWDNDSTYGLGKYLLRLIGYDLDLAAYVFELAEDND